MARLSSRRAYRLPSTDLLAEVEQLVGIIEASVEVHEVGGELVGVAYYNQALCGPTSLDAAMFVVHPGRGVAAPETVDVRRGAAQTAPV